MNPEQINELFELIRKSKPKVRKNIRSLYLDRIGEKIIPYCQSHYHIERNANVRNDMVRFVIQYAKSEKRVIEFAKQTLLDKSKKVIESGLAIFAYSCDENQIKYLKSQESKLKRNKNDLDRAIKAIRNGNHNHFYPEYSKWEVTQNDLSRHLKNNFKDEVDFYIKKNGNEVVPELIRILVKLY